MSEEKKIVELNDEYLEQVSGGKQQVEDIMQGEWDYRINGGACGQNVTVNTNNDSMYGLCYSYDQTNPNCLICKYGHNYVSDSDK